MSTCHVCGSTASTPIMLGVGADRELHRCGKCGFIYLAAWEETLERAADLYDYYARFSGDDLRRRYSPENRSRQRQLLQHLSRHVEGRRLFEVGCGEGQILRTAGSEGWNAVGVDLSEAAIRICRQHGLSASRTDFFASALDRRRFDVIVMSELIEHVPSPQRFLERAEQLLEPGGVLYLTTPNFGSLARRMLGGSWSPIHPQHIGYFDRRTLRSMVEGSTGLSVIRIDANNITPSTIVAWIRSRTATIQSAAAVHHSAKRGIDQRLRRALKASAPLRTATDLVNRAVSIAGLGDTLVAWLQKPVTQRTQKRV